MKDWQTNGAARLAQLEGMHVQATGTGPGRRWQTAQLNRSLLVALVAQFQAFCRGLHDDAVAVHIESATAGQRTVLQALLTQGRKLGTGNPRVSALAADFGRQGFQLVSIIEAADPAAREQLRDLDLLVDFRNAIVHGNESEIAAIEAAGRVRATKAEYARSRRSLNALARTLDSVVADQIMTLLSIPRPW